jgi:hypothetical protein
MTDTPKRSNTQAARTKEFNRRRFIWLDQVMTDGKLAASAFKVAYKLGQHFNEAQGGAAWPSIQTISAGTALPKTVVMRAVRGLQERGHLAIEARRQGRGHSNRYLMVLKGPQADLCDAEGKGPPDEIKGLFCDGKESRSRKSAQDAKWSFCLTAGKIGPRIRRDNEQTSAPDAHTGLQGKGGAFGHQGRDDAGAAGRAL